MEELSDTLTTLILYISYQILHVFLLYLYVSVRLSLCQRQYYIYNLFYAENVHVSTVSQVAQPIKSVHN